MKQSFLYALFSAFIAAAFFTGAPAFGQAPPAGETYVSYVRTADLDLDSTRGQSQLDQRLAHAAREVCGVASDADMAGKNQVRVCREEAIARAASQRESLLAAAERGAVIAITATR